VEDPSSISDSHIRRRKQLPPPENPPEDLAEAPLLDPFAALNTES